MSSTIDQDSKTVKTNECSLGNYIVFMLKLALFYKL